MILRGGGVAIPALYCRRDAAASAQRGGVDPVEPIAPDEVDAPVRDEPDVRGLVVRVVAAPLVDVPGVLVPIVVPVAPTELLLLPPGVDMVVIAPVPIGVPGVGETVEPIDPEAPGCIPGMEDPAAPPAPIVPALAGGVVAEEVAPAPAPAVWARAGAATMAMRPRAGRMARMITLRLVRRG